MCLAFPAKVLEIRENFLATIEHSGIKREASLMLLPDAKVGDYVLIHAGFAMQVVDEEEIKIRNALVAEMNGAPRTVSEIKI